MLKLLPMQVSYANKVNAIMRASLGITTQDAGVEIDKVLKSQEEGWTEQQFVDWFCQRYDMIPNTQGAF